MSYERDMLSKYNMPSKRDVRKELLKSLFRYGGTIQEFGEGEYLVDEIARKFSLNKEQREAYLETTYYKENRLKRTNLWHRLLYRAAESLAREDIVSHPKDTQILTGDREWMLTERGYEEALKLIGYSTKEKENFDIKSYELTHDFKEIVANKKPKDYSPFVLNKEKKKKEVQKTLRKRSFRFSVIEAYNHKCAVCGLKLYSPDMNKWEVEAAHIIPHHKFGKDDIWNGFSLCKFHHWAFDVGWFSLSDDYNIILSKSANDLPTSFGKMWNHNLFNLLASNKNSIHLPSFNHLWPDKYAIDWHRKNILK